MKTTAKFSELKRIIAFTALLPLLQVSYSQDIALNEEIQEITIRQIENNTLVDFKAIYNTGNIYLQWLVKNETEDGLFIIERSPAGKNFEAIGYKHGIGVPVSSPILYCSTDTQPLQDDTCCYRLVKSYADGRYYYSDVIKLVSPPQAIDIHPEKTQKESLDTPVIAKEERLKQSQ